MSSKILKCVVVLTLTIAVAGGILTAKASRKSFASATHLTPPPAASKKVTLQKSIFVSGFSGVSLPVGTFTTVDGTTLKCPGTSGSCIYESENHLQILSSAASNWAILTTVDGTFIGDGGPYLGPVGTDYAAGIWSDVSSATSLGNHSLTTQAYMRDASATAYNYSFNYRVYR
jgi:hypothetical protein